MKFNELKKIINILILNNNTNNYIAYLQMEDIYAFTLSQRHIIESEYYKLKTENPEQFTNLDINQIGQLYESVLKNIELTNNQLTNAKNAKLEQIANFKKKTKENKNKRLSIGLEIVEKLLDQYSDGIYGIINYFSDHSDENLLKYILTKKAEFNNKPAVISKLIKNNKLSAEALSDSYGFIFMFDKTDDAITDLNKVHMLKNGNIYKMNNPDENEEDDEEDESKSDNESISKTDSVDKIVTKVYEFGSKIVLKEVIYESTLEELEDELNGSDEEFVENSDEEHKLQEELKLLTDKKLKLDNLYKIDKKYRKYINDNVKSPDIRELLFGFSFVRSLLKKVFDPSKQLLDIQNFLKYDFSDKFERVKISNRLDQSEYNELVEKYFGDDIEQITSIILESYDVYNKFKPYMVILFDILCRIQIDEHLEHKSYCLNKNISEYFNFRAIMSEPDTQTITLKRRHWNQLLESEDPKKIITSILMLISTKTKTIDQTLKYLESLYRDSNIKTTSN